MRRTLLIPLLLALACATNDPYDNPEPEPRGGMRGGGMGGGMRMRGNFGGDDDLLPEANWWHSPHLAEAVNVSGDQMQQLDKLQTEQGDEIERLSRDVMVASRDIRNAVNQHDAVANDITAAGDRVASLRDQLFRRRIAMLAGERAILTYDQWTKLQQTFAEERMDRGRDRGGYGPGMGGRGRGGRGGMGGRRPPF